MWKDNADFQISILRTDDRFIYCDIKDSKNDTMWLVAFIMDILHITFINNFGKNICV